MNFTKSAVAMILGVSLSQAASAGLIFTVAEGSVPGTPVFGLNADAINFGFSASLSQTLVGGALDGDDPFTISGSSSFTGFLLNNAAVPSFLNTPDFAGGYAMVASFSGTGFAEANGDGVRANYDTFLLSIHIDTDQDGIPDYQILSSALSVGDEGDANVFFPVTGVLANGDFEIETTILTYDPAFFTTPLLEKISFAGNTTIVNGVALLGNFDGIVNGVGEVFFEPAAVPEPGSLALLGLGLAGLGLALRRRRAA